MFADLHHLHQFISLDQGGSVTGASWVGGTNATDANIYFGKHETKVPNIFNCCNTTSNRFGSGALHIDSSNAAEDWLDDDQVSAMNTGGNGPVTRNEGMYNGYAAVKTYWSDTVVMDNLRGGDATGVATPGAQEITSTASSVSGTGNTTHTYSGDSFY